MTGTAWIEEGGLLEGPNWNHEYTQCRHCARHDHCMAGKGEVYSYTTVYEAPAGFDANAPYTVAIVKLEEGAMLTA
jgi:uncharacterized OB-fold protein